MFKEDAKTAILVIKKDEVIRKDVADALAERHIDVICTREAEKLPGFAHACKPALILICGDVPEPERADACKTLKANVGTCGIPVVSLHAHFKEEHPADTDINQYLLRLAQTLSIHDDFCETSGEEQGLSSGVETEGRLTEEYERLKKHNRELIKRLKEMERIAVTDPLTGIYNRRYMFGRFNEELARFNRTRRPFSFVFCDVDGFKRINDTYGHAFGDHVLIEVARFIQECCREQDILCRWGGEEFLLLLPDTDKQGACMLAERLRKGFEACVIRLGNKDIHVTVTLGVAEYEESAGVEGTIVHADNALLKGKNSGKNCVIFYQDSVCRAY